MSTGVYHNARLYLFQSNLNIILYQQTKTIDILQKSKNISAAQKFIICAKNDNFYPWPAVCVLDKLNVLDLS